MRVVFSLPVLVLGILVTAGSVYCQSNEAGQPVPELEARASGYLGVWLSDINADRARALRLGEARGVEIMRVEKGSPAQEAGLKDGDVLLSYNGENIVGAQQLGRLVEETPQGRKVKLQYWRDGKAASTTVTTGARTATSFNFPIGPNFEMPDARAFGMPDIPDPMLIWKNSLLGIECESVDSQLAQYFGVKRGVLVRSVIDGSVAQKAGLKAGDVVTAIGDREVATPHDLRSYMRSDRRPVTSVLLEFTRERKPMKVIIPLPGR
ncbi:MAG TPA: PDZ domain-containing protein [Bryobacteraceae bacterium]|jgi:serine protease Do